MRTFQLQPSAPLDAPTEAQFRITAPAMAVRIGPGRRSWGPSAAVLGLAAVLRAVWALAVPVVPVSDSVAYDTFARNLAAGLPYGWDGATPSAYWPVGAPFMYSLVYRVCHPDAWGYWPATALNLVIGLVLVGLSMALAHRWFGRPVALATGVILALWPWHIQFTTVLASESIFTALCLAGILAWPATPKRLVLRGIAAGVILAAAAYVRPTALLIPVVLTMGSVIRERTALGPMLKLGLAALVMAACLAPWAYRNHVQIGKAALVSTNGGPNLWMGNNPGTSGFYEPLPPQPEGMTEAEFHSHLGDEAVRYIRENPGAFVLRTAVKAVRLYERETIGVLWNEPGIRRNFPGAAVAGLKVGSQGYWMLVLSAAVGGLVVLVRTQGVLKLISHPCVVLPAYFTAVHAVIVIQDRYHFPMTPMVAMLAAVACVHLRAWGRERQERPVRPAAA